MRKIFLAFLVISAITFITINYYQSHKNKPVNPKAVITEQPPEQLKVQTQGPTTPTKLTSSSSPLAVIDKKARMFTMAEVAKHGLDPDNYVDCWTVIRDKVYDITKYADSLKHPGGEQIYQACGTDATTLFETRPTGSKTPHSVDARKILDKYYIGDLQK